MLNLASLLAITSELPWPLDSGGHLRTFHLLKSLTGHYRVRLIAGVPAGRQADVEAVRDAGIDVIAAVLPDRRPWLEGVRLAHAAIRAEPYIFYRRHDRAAIWTALRQAIAAEPPDVFYLDHLDSMLFAEVCRPGRLVVDLHNIYSLLAERTATEHRSRPARAYLRREARLLAQIERRAMARADLVMTVSREEGAAFAAAGARNVCLVPNGVDCLAYSELPLGRETPAAPIVLFVGGLSWAPNVSAVQFLAKTMLPELRRTFPAARVRVVGRGDSDALRELRDLPGVEMVGAVPDVRPHLAEASVLGVALEAGGGTRLKILEAFAAGLPVVSTPVGCEGIAAEHGRQLVIAERPAFADEIGALLRAPEVGRRLASEAREVARRIYDWDIVGKQAADAILALG